MAHVAAGTIDRISDIPIDNAGQPVRPDAGMRPSGHGGFATAPHVDPRVQEYRRAGMNTINKYSVRHVLPTGAADRLDRVLREGDGQGLTARYLAAAGNDHYATAFAKMCADPQMGHLRFSPQEVEAVHEASFVQEQHRIMNAALTTGA